MSHALLINIAITIAVLLWVLYRQLSTRPIKERSKVGIILIGVGVVETLVMLQHGTPTAEDIGLLLLSLLIGIGLAAVRATTVKIWSTHGVALRRGTILTALLWLVSIAQHLAVEHFISDGLGEATLLIYLGFVLAAQQRILIVRAKSRGLFAEPADTSPEPGRNGASSVHTEK